METSSTSQNLLTRDGAFCVTFSPAIEPPQYDQLYDLCLAIESKDDLKRVVTMLAKRWGRKVEVE